MTHLMISSMPRLISILIVAATSLAGCTSEHEREVDAAKSTIRETLRLDWNNGIPVAELIHADQLCKKYGPLWECAAVTDQLSDVTISLASCKSDMRSRLCKKVVASFEKSLFAYLLSISQPVTLPDSPFYWSMPTTTLEVIAPKFGYRQEVATWWWGRWRQTVMSCIVIISLLYGFLLGWTHRQRHKKFLAEQEMDLLEKEKSQQALQAKLRAEAKARADAAAQKLITEQERIKAAQSQQEQLAKKKAAEKIMQNKLASEQAEAQKLLDAAFCNTKKPKRRKHVTPPQ